MIRRYGHTNKIEFGRRRYSKMTIASSPTVPPSPGLILYANTGRYANDSSVRANGSY